MLAHLRMETYGAYRQSIYPGSLAEGATTLSVEGNEQAIWAGRRRLEKPG
jgi:hypothetical protein